MKKLATIGLLFAILGGKLFGQTPNGAYNSPALGGTTTSSGSGIPYGAGGGTAQAQTVTTTPNVTALTTGTFVTWLPTAANTAAAPTLAAGTTAATAITKCGTVALVAGDLLSTVWAVAQYDGAEWVLQNPVQGGCLGGMPTGGGTANAQTLTVSPAITAYSAGQVWNYIPGVGNTGATTLAISGLTARSVTKCGTTALASGDLTTTAIAVLLDDGTRLQLLNPQAATCGASGGSSAWSSLTNAAANLSLNNTGFNTTFSQNTTGGTDSWTWQNTTAAVVGTCQPSPSQILAGTYWTGAASAADSWTIQAQCGNGTNGTETLNFAHSGSTGRLSFGFQGGSSIRFDGGLLNLSATGGNSVSMISGSDVLFNGTNNANAITNLFGDNSNGTSLVSEFLTATPGQKDVLVTMLKATAALTSGQVVKIDSANANSIVVATTTDTGAGSYFGFVENSPGAGAVAQIALPGSIITDPILGTGTCSIGNFVINDTTTNGRVKCTGTFTAGTILGYAITAQASVGSAVSVYVLPR